MHGGADYTRAARRSREPGAGRRKHLLTGRSPHGVSVRTWIVPSACVHATDIPSASSARPVTTPGTEAMRVLVAPVPTAGPIQCHSRSRRPVPCATHATIASLPSDGAPAACRPPGTPFPRQWRGGRGCARHPTARPVVGRCSSPGTGTGRTRSPPGRRAPARRRGGRSSRAAIEVDPVRTTRSTSGSRVLPARRRSSSTNASTIPAPRRGRSQGHRADRGSGRAKATDGRSVQPALAARPRSRVVPSSRRSATRRPLVRSASRARAAAAVASPAPAGVGQGVHAAPDDLLQERLDRPRGRGLPGHRARLAQRSGRTCDRGDVHRRAGVEGRRAAPRAAKAAWHRDRRPGRAYVGDRIRDRDSTRARRGARPGSAPCRRSPDPRPGPSSPRPPGRGRTPVRTGPGAGIRTSKPRPAGRWRRRAGSASSSR